MTRTAEAVKNSVRQSPRVPKSRDPVFRFSTCLPWSPRRGIGFRVYSSFVNRFSATPFGSWIVKHVAARIDPVLFRLTDGRFTSTGVPTLPMLTLSTVGRKSGKRRDVQLAFHRDGDDYLIVASAMGQELHPDWKYNLEANPDVEVLVRGEVFAARAGRLTDEEKTRVWPAIKRTIPQMDVYERRTCRNINVFRLRRAAL